MPSLTKRERRVASRYRRYQKVFEAAHDLCKRADQLMLETAHMVIKAGKSIEHRKRTGEIERRVMVRFHEDGRQLHCIDKTVGDDLIIDYGHGAVRRYDLKVVDPS